MKSRLFIALICAMILAPAMKTHARIGVGIVVGEPTGLSIRVNHFPVLGVTWSIPGNRMQVSADYWIIHKPLEHPLYWYLGLGGAIGVRDGGAFLGARVPLGLQLPFERDWELFGELVPVVGLIPDVGLYLNGGIGIRYFF
jgi:hypothetical protein